MVRMSRGNCRCYLLLSPRTPLVQPELSRPDDSCEDGTRKVAMTRFLGIIVFGAGFLFISPSLRASAMEMVGEVAKCTSLYSPYSYIVLAIAILAGVTLTLRTGQAAR